MAVAGAVPQRRLQRLGGHLRPPPAAPLRRAPAGAAPPDASPLAALAIHPGPLRIGLLADTHVPEALPALWPQAYAAFEGCDAIIHAGDVYDVEMLDKLAAIAPCVAARGNGDDADQPKRALQPERDDFSHNSVQTQRPEPAERRRLEATSASTQRWGWGRRCTCSAGCGSG